jgi:hypothetical protein
LLIENLRFSRLSAALLASLAPGCGMYGPESVRVTHIDYNISIQQTNKRELLLNLVRLKYRDTLNLRCQARPD